MSTAHANCTHPKTKSARAACRRAAKGGAPVAPVVKPLATEIQTPVEPSRVIREVTDVTVREIAMSAQIDLFQLEATRAKIEKINARAERKGLAGTLTMTSEPVECSEVDELTKMTRTWTEYKVEIKGNAPAYNGWEFIAKLDWDANAGLIVRNVPGYEGVNRETVKEGYCDHCKTTRRRLVTYVVRNQETGETVQVGSSCLKDFTGQYTTIAFPELSADDDESEGGFFGARAEREYDPATVLAVAWACVKLEGYKPRDSYGSSTRDDVMTALYPSKSKHDREFAATIAPLADEAQGKAQELLEFIASDAFGGKEPRDYHLNMKAIAAGKFVSRRNIGLLASAPQAWAKHMERTLIREREASIYKASQWFGTAPDKAKGVKASRHDLTVTVKAIRYIDGDYGTTTLYTMVTEDGNVAKWFSSGTDKLGENVGARFVIRGSVKKHDEWEGMKATVLTRCTVIDELEPVEGE